MINDIQNDAKARMRKCIDAFQFELSKLRTGRAHPSLLEHIKVDYYGSELPLSQVANISVQDARMLTVTPWEKSMVPVIEKAILQSDLGLNPATQGSVIRVPLPALTEERRRDLAKVLKTEAEKTRVSIRNVRRDANQHCKDLLKEKEISEDDEKKAAEFIQKFTDQFIAEVDQVLVHKEKDIMEI